MKSTLRQRLGALSPRRKVAVFVDRYPLLGPAFWAASLQYLLVQIAVAADWPMPGYNWSRNAISDLGNTQCGAYVGRFVCSPQHWLMNVSFVALGLTMLAGSVLIAHEFRKVSYGQWGFLGMAIAGVGAVLVGIFPENIVSSMHVLGALLAFAVGDLAMVVFGTVLPLGGPMRLYTFLSGVIGLAGLTAYMTHHYFGLGLGGMERVAGYPQTVWLIVFGVYMMRNHFRRV